MRLPWTETVEKLSAKGFSLKLIYAAKKKLKVKCQSNRNTTRRYQWALPGSLPQAEDTGGAKDVGEIYQDSRGRWLRALQFKLIHDVPGPVLRLWARRDSIVRAGKALRSKKVRIQDPNSKRPKVFLEADWFEIADGKEYKRHPGQGPGPIHAKMQRDKLQKAKEQLLAIIPKGSPVPAETVLAAIRAMDINHYVAWNALDQLGGTKTSTVENWSTGVRGRKKWWWSLPDSAYEAATNGASSNNGRPPREAKLIGNDGAAPQHEPGAKRGPKGRPDRQAIQEKAYETLCKYPKKKWVKMANEKLTIKGIAYVYRTTSAVKKDASIYAKENDKPWPPKKTEKVGT